MWCPCLLCRFLAHRRRRAAWLLFLPAVTMALAMTMPPAAAAAAAHHERPVFRPPVDAPVTDPFRPPENPYGPGNRGVEYDTEPGDAVRAAASGTVVFAGAVAGTLHVTVDHGGGLVSSYSYLQRLGVRVGTDVDQGAVIGVAGERLHFSVRLEGAYTDPAGFIGVRRVRVRLVPLRSARSACGPRTLLRWPLGARRRRTASPNHSATRAFTRSFRRPARAT